MRNAKTALWVVLGSMFGSAGCGLIADAISDAAKTEIESDLFPPIQLGQEYVEPMSFLVSVDEANSTFGIPESLDTSSWGPIIAAHNQFVDNGLDGIFDFQVESWTLDADEPIYFMVDVFSRDSLVVAETLNTTPTAVPSCDFTLDPLTQGADDYSAAMTTCLTDWVRANGIPYQLDFDVTTGPASGRQVTSEYTMTNHSHMVAMNNVEIHTYERQLEVDGDVIDNADLIDITNMGIDSEAKWKKLPEILNDPTCKKMDVPLSVFGYGVVIDTRPDQNQNTFGFVFSPMTDNRDYIYKVTTSDNGKVSIESDYLLVGWSPAMPKWMKQTLEIGIGVQVAAGKDEEVAVPVRGAYVVAGHCPREGDIDFVLTGLAHFNTEKE